MKIRNITEFYRVIPPHFKQQTGQTNLYLAGGVTLNSVLNGHLAHELGLENVSVLLYPGDDGIAVECCAYGLFGNVVLEKAGGGGRTDSLFVACISLPWLPVYQRVGVEGD